MGDKLGFVAGRGSDDEDIASMSDDACMRRFYAIGLGAGVTTTLGLADILSGDKGE